LIHQVWADDILPGGTDCQAVGRFVIRAEAETLPHGRGFRVANAPAIINCIARVSDLLDPIGESAHELAIIMWEAGGEIERTFRANRADRASRHAKLAFEAWVVINRLVIVAGLAAHQHRTQQHKIPELWMNQVAVNAHMTQSGFDGDRLV